MERLTKVAPSQSIRRHKDMDMMTKREIDRRIKKGVKNIHISPLFEKGKTYDLSSHKENPNGTLSPTNNHCYIQWTSLWNDDGELKESKEAYSFPTLEQAQEAREYLEKHLIR